MGDAVAVVVEALTGAGLPRSAAVAFVSRPLAAKVLLVLLARERATPLPPTLSELRAALGARYRYVKRVVEEMAEPGNPFSERPLLFLQRVGRTVYVYLSSTGREYAEKLAEGLAEAAGRLAAPEDVPPSLIEAAREKLGGVLVDAEKLRALGGRPGSLLRRWDLYSCPRRVSYRGRRLLLLAACKKDGDVALKPGRPDVEQGGRQPHSGGDAPGG